MKTRTIIVALLGLLLLVGSSHAERRKSISARTSPHEDAPRERVVEETVGQRGKSSSGGVSNRESFHEPVHITGVMRASRSRGFSIGGETLLLGSNCGFFPVDDPGRLPSPRAWNGRQVSVFGYRTRAGIDARLLILQDGSGQGGSGHHPEMIPSPNDPTVGVQRRGTPG